MHALCEFYKIRITEIYKEIFTEAILFFPLDQAITVIMKNYCHKRNTHSYGSLIFLAVHHKSAVTGNRQNFAFRIDQFCRDRTRYGNSHRRKSIGNNTGIRFIASIMSCDPHLMCTYIGNHDIISAHFLSDIIQDLLRFHRKAGIILITLIFFFHHFFYFSETPRFLCLTASL